MEPFIPVSKPLLGELEEKNLIECVRSGWISSGGPFVQQLEEKMADYCSRKYGVSLSSGTAALQVAFECLHLKKGDEVILPSFTIISCVIAVIETGATPVLVDVDPETWTMNPQDVAKKINRNTKAILCVHIYGHPVDMDPMLELAQEHNLVIIEDAAEAIGSEYKGKKCGGVGHIGIFSFYGNKLISCGEGGMLLTDNEEFAQRARQFRNMCFGQDERFRHDEIGHNYRMTNMQAALGVAQFERVDSFVERKREVARRYNEAFQDLPLQLPVERDWALSTYWMYGLLLEKDSGLDAISFAKKLEEQYVQCRPFFLGMHEQPVLQRMGYFKGITMKVTELLYRRGVYLPCGQAITDTQIETVIERVHRIFEVRNN